MSAMPDLAQLQLQLAGGNKASANHTVFQL